MDDAYVIGIRLALDNGVSAGVSAIRGDLAALDRAVAASSAQLEALRRAAATVLLPAGPAPAPAVRETPRVAERRLPSDASEAKSASAEADTLPDVIAASLGSSRPQSSAQGSQSTVPEAARATAVPAAFAAPRRLAEIEQTGVVVPTRASPMPARSPAAAAFVASPATRPVEAQVRPAVLAAEKPVAYFPAPAVQPPNADFAARGRTLLPQVRPREDEAAGLARREEREAAQAGRPRIAAASHDVARPPSGSPAAPDLAVAPTGGSPSLTTEALASPRRVGRSVTPLAGSGPFADARMAPTPMPPPLAMARQEQGATQSLAPALPSAVPPADAGGASRLTGDVYLDGARVGRWMADRMERDAGRPPVGPTFFDPRQSPAWAGATVGL